MANNDEPLFVEPVLLQQAEHLCRERLKNDPENRAVLCSLAEVYRKLGNLAGAAAAYERLSYLDPQDQEAGYMHAILGGKEWPTMPKGIRAAPLLLLKDFLPGEFHDALLPFFISVQERFVPALVGDGIYNPDHRETLDFLDSWAGMQRFKDSFKRILPGVIPRLHLPPFKIEGIEVYVRAYQNGHFFKVHKDVPTTTSVRADRKISYVYFFHRVPRPYGGGELLLFDSNPEVNSEYTTARFTRVVPEDNSLVLFPSNFFHCVVPVRCPSKEFADSRFVINGFVRKRTEPKPAVEGSVESAEAAAGT